MDARLDSNSDEYQTRVKVEKSMTDHEFVFHGDRLDDITCFRKCAEKARLGIVRNNNFFYTQKASWVYLDAWVIGEELRAVCMDQLQNHVQKVVLFAKRLAKQGCSVRRIQ